ncbi:MAG TPA: BRCT domain-containing protein [Arenicellales bacterium]|nr:BRCT domain-containing protein [Arenicellales bacterium]
MPTDDAWRNKSGLYAGIKQRQELAGMIDGVLADSTINIHEVVHLATWLRDQREELGGAFVRLAEDLDDVLADGRVDADEESTLRVALLEARELCGLGCDSDSDELTRRLVGFLKGMTADHAINDAELASLRALLCEAPDSPIAASVRRTVDLYADDRSQLWRSLCALAGHDPASGVVCGLAIGGVFDDPSDPADLDVEGVSFCLTGTFSFGSRSRCAQRIRNLGGAFHRNITRATDYLVIGTMETKAWAGTNYGRKIEAALGRKTNGNGPLVISETAWDEASALAESGRTRYKAIDPDEYFAQWAYPPNRPQRSALGVELRERMDAERTRAARERAKATGTAAKEVAAIRIMTRQWTLSHPPAYDFHVGDLFHSGSGETSVQVAHDGNPLEVHSNQSGMWAPYQVTPEELAHWLRTGVEPARCRISAYQCQSELHKFLLAAEEKRREEPPAN